MRLPFCLCLLLCPVLSSQEKAPLQFVSFFGYDNVVRPTEIYLQTGKEAFTPLSLPGANATDAVKVLNPSGAIVIYGEPVTDPEGKVSYPRLGSIKCDPAWPKAFVIVSSIEKDEKIVFSGAAFALSNKDFPEGSIKVANLSPALVRGKVGPQEVDFKPGEIATIRFESKPGSLVDVIFQYKMDRDTPWRRMMSTRWAIPESGRSLMFVAPNPRGTGMRSRTIPLRSS